MPNATILGAGPAGCLAAIILARRGWDITLVEQHRFPRDKVCGECLSALGVDTLARLDLLDPLRVLRPVSLTRARFVAPDGSAATLRLPRPMWGISRAALDGELLAQARSSGARILQPARCERIDTSDPSVTLRDLNTNAIETLHPSYLLIATGKSSAPPTGDLGIKAHFQNVAAPADTIQLFTLASHYVGLAAIEGNRWNLAMSVPAARVKHFAGDLDALWQHLLEENRGLAGGMRHATRIGDWLAAPLPRFGVVPRWQPRIIPLGNSAAALDPIGGEGIGLALLSAALAAGALDDSHRSQSPLDVALLRRQFKNLWRFRRPAARAAALLLSRPRLARLTVAALNCNTALAALILGPLGKQSGQKFLHSPFPSPIHTPDMVSVATTPHSGQRSGVARMS